LASKIKAFMGIKTIFRLLPWLIVLVLSACLWIKRLSTHVTPQKFSIEQTTILQEIESLGKLELVKYRFKEVIEAEELAKRYLDFGIFYFPAGQDQKAVLIAKGEAVACVDLTKLDSSDFQIERDTIYITLPKPELCYYKVDLDKSSFYDLETSRDSKKSGEFINKVYKQAESQIKTAAIESGILEDAEGMAALVLNPLFKGMTNKTIVIHFKLKAVDVSEEGSSLLK
jgi:hypothetical protein